MGLLPAVCIALLAAPGDAVAADQAPADVVRWAANVAPAAAAPGERLRVELTAEIEPGWRVYATTQPPTGPRPLVVSLDPSRSFELRAAEIETSLPRIEPDANFNQETQFYEDHATLTVPITVKRTAARGKQQLILAVTFQACSGRLCLRPATVEIPVEVTITTGRPSKKGARQ